MLFVISLVFIFLIRLCFPSKLSIVEVLRKRYSDKISEIRKFEKTDIKHKKALLDLQFLKVCEDHNVIPKFLHSNVADAPLCSYLSQTISSKEIIM